MAAVEVRLSSAEAQLDKESEKVKQREADAQQTKVPHWIITHTTHSSCHLEVCN